MAAQLHSSIQRLLLVKLVHLDAFSNVCPFAPQAGSLFDMTHVDTSIRRTGVLEAHAAPRLGRLLRSSVGLTPIPVLVRARELKLRGLKARLATL